MKAKRVKEIFSQISDETDVVYLGDEDFEGTPFFIKSDLVDAVFIGMAERIGDLSYGELLNPEDEL